MIMTKLAHSQTQAVLFYVRIHSQSVVCLFILSLTTCLGTNDVENLITVPCNIHS